MMFFRSSSNVLRLLCLLLIGLLSGVALSAQGPAQAEIRIVSPAEVTDNQVSVQLLVRDANGQSVPALAASNFTISEETQGLTVETNAVLPLGLAVIVDLSNGSDVDLIRASLSAYFNAYYQPEDRVAFYLLDRSSTGYQLLEPTGLEEIRAFIDALDRRPEFFTITDAVQDSLRWLLALRAEDALRSLQAIYFGSFLHDSRETDAAALYAAERIPFHVVHSHRYREPVVPLLRALAESGGGLYVNNLEGGFVTTGDEGERAAGLLKILYDTIDGGRIVYTLRYQPLSESLNLQRVVTLTAVLTGDVRASAEFIYEQPFLPPAIDFITATFNPVRVPSRNGEALSFDIEQYPLVVRVSFPDGRARQVESLRLEVYDPQTNNVTESKLELSPQQDAAGNYVVFWPLGGYLTPGTTTPVELVLTVTDELGLSSEARREGAVSVGVLPPLPTPTSIPTAVPTALPTLAPTQIPPTAVPQPTSVPVVAQAQEFQIAGMMVSAQQLFLLIILLLLAIILALLILLLRTRRQQSAAPVQPDALTITQQSYLSELQKQALRAEIQAVPEGAAGHNGESDEPYTLYGRLIVTAGIEAQEILLNREEFLIGRSAAEGAHFIIPEPYISPRHCMFSFKNGQITIRDLGSKNGTFVNGERLPRDRDVIVPIGSEIGITRNIVMELWDPKRAINLEERRAASQQAEHQSHAGAAGLEFRPVLGIQYTRDESSELGDDYSPL